MGYSIECIRLELRFSFNLPAVDEDPKEPTKWLQ